MRFPAYPKYKSSGVAWLGNIPDHWDATPLKICLTRNDGGVWGDDFDDEGTIVLRSTEQTVDGRWIIEDPARRRLTPSERAGSLLESGDIVITKSSGSSLHIGKTSIVTDEVASLGCCYSNFMQRLRSRAGIEPKYIFYLLNSELGRAQFDYLANTTTGLANLTKGMIGGLLFAWPPLPEQRTIAAFLDRETARIDALIAKKQRLIELLQEKRAALISHAVTRGLDPGAPLKDSGIEWLGQIPAHWEIKKIKSLLLPRSGAIKVGPFGSQLLSSDMTGGEVKVFNQRTVIDADFEVGDNYITAEKFAELRAFEVFAGDLLVTTRGTIGRCAIVPKLSEPAILHPCLMRLQIDHRKADPQYIAMVIESSRLVREQLGLMSNATTIEVIYSESLKSVSIPLPPVHEQRDILEKLTEQLSAVDFLLDATQEAIRLVAEYRASLIAHAVTGKIDVREAVPA